MKQAWIIGTVMLYLLIFACEVFATGGLSFSTTSSGMVNVATGSQSTLLNPSIQESAVWAVMTGVASYIKTFIGMIFLWSPTVFSGYMIWAYWFICFPVAVSFVMCILFIIRGVGTS